MKVLKASVPLFHRAISFPPFPRIITYVHSHRVLLCVSFCLLQSAARNAKGRGT